MDIAPIKTHRDYLRTLEEIESLMRAKRNTPEGYRLDLLVALVEAWEAKRCPLDCRSENNSGGASTVERRHQ